jgi:hypothetical protein
MLQLESILHFFILLNNTALDGHTTFYIHFMYIGFCTFPLLTSATLSIFCVSFCVSICFNSFEYILGNGIAKRSAEYFQVEVLVTH